MRAPAPGQRLADTGIGSSADKFRAVVNAYGVLSDPQTRRDYDATLARSRSRNVNVPEPLIPPKPNAEKIHAHAPLRCDIDPRRSRNQKSGHPQNGQYGIRPSPARLLQASYTFIKRKLNPILSETGRRSRHFSGNRFRWPNAGQNQECRLRKEGVTFTPLVRS